MKKILALSSLFLLFLFGNTPGSFTPQVLLSLIYTLVVVITSQEATCSSGVFHSPAHTLSVQHLEQFVVLSTLLLYYY